MSHTCCDACDGYGFILVAGCADGRSKIVEQSCAACGGTGRCPWR
ncbi:hypothetical protein AB0K05_12990 [Nonomuraea sp. NPDC049486]